MKKFILPVCLLLVLACGCHQEKQEAPYNRASASNDYERTFRNHIFASCIDTGKFYATYALAHVDAKPTECDPRYKVTFVNGPCKGKTILTEDVIVKTSPIGGGQLVKGDVVLRDFWNPKKHPTNIEDMDRWNRGVVYDTSRREKGVIELEFPRDRNDFMATREFIFLQNIRYIEKPEPKDPRIFL